MNHRHFMADKPAVGATLVTLLEECPQTGDQLAALLRKLQGRGFHQAVIPVKTVDDASVFSQGEEMSPIPLAARCSLDCSCEILEESPFSGLYLDIQGYSPFERSADVLKKLAQGVERLYLDFSTHGTPYPARSYFQYVNEMISYLTTIGFPDPVVTFTGIPVSARIKVYRLAKKSLNLPLLFSLDMQTDELDKVVEYAAAAGALLSSNMVAYLQAPNYHTAESHIVSQAVISASGIGERVV